MQFKKTFLFTLFIGFILACGWGNLKNKIIKEKTAQTKQSCELKENTGKTAEHKQPTITIWVHGTRLITRFALQEILYGPAGISNICDIPKSCHMHKIARNLSALDPDRFKIKNFYLFGWSGRLDFNERKKAAEDLYAALTTIAMQYKEQHGVTPVFRIITHSHGGNVALNLAEVKREQAPFTVSELILLACPVQERTKKFVEDPLFKRVYSLFSRGEFLQIADPQGIYKENKNYPLFSKRLFPDHQKLSQAEIKIYGRSILHSEFIFGHFVNKLPAILNVLDKEQQMGAKVSKKNAETDYVIIDLKKKQVSKNKRRRIRKIVLT
ncbi:hypothetical protein E3J79_00760 [Candidatus Dependentiae bacterium]|nr:MAG: hypothetical protein E3J79_00760 [Candidatus Dependentiae bacterium]